MRTDDEIKEPRFNTRKRVTMFVILVLSAGAAVSVLSKLVVQSEDAHYSYPATTKVELDVEAGDVKLSASTGNSVEVNARTKHVWRKAGTKSTFDSGTLKIRQKCPDLNIGPCSTDFSIAIPPGVDVSVKALRNVTATGLRGDLAIDGKSGYVKAKDVYGKLDIKTSSGGVRLEKVSSLDVSARTQSGEISSAFSVDPVRVDAETKSGSVNIDVPNDKEQYKVDASSAAGKLVVDTHNVDTAQRSIRVRSQSGNVTVS